MIELLRTRRSIRKFTPDRIDSRQIGILTEAALRAPSSRGRNPWEFVVVDDPQIMLGLSQAKRHGSEFLRNAPLGIVICADSSISDVWIEDCSIAAIIIQLTAHSLGLGSCWAQIRDRRHDAEDSAEEFVQKQLGIPAHIRVEAIVGIGHPDEEKNPLSAEALQHAKIRSNHW